MTGPDDYSDMSSDDPLLRELRALGSGPAPKPTPELEELFSTRTGAGAVPTRKAAGDAGAAKVVAIGEFATDAVSPVSRHRDQRLWWIASAAAVVLAVGGILTALIGGRGTRPPANQPGPVLTPAHSLTIMSSATVPVQTPSPSMTPQAPATSAPADETSRASPPEQHSSGHDDGAAPQPSSGRQDGSPERASSAHTDEAVPPADSQTDNPAPQTSAEVPDSAAGSTPPGSAASDPPAPARSASASPSGGSDDGSGAGQSGASSDN